MTNSSFPSCETLVSFLLQWIFDRIWFNDWFHVGISILCDLAEKYMDFSYKRIFFRNKMNIFILYFYNVCECEWVSECLCMCGNSSLYLVKNFSLISSGNGSGEDLSFDILKKVIYQMMSEHVYAYLKNL